MGDMGDYYNDLREARKQRKREHGIDCPGCIATQPKRIPTRLLPGQRCRVCNYRRPAEEVKG
jgi:hypothetical protein